MKTTIGQSLEVDRLRSLALALCGLAMVGLDLYLSWKKPFHNLQRGGLVGVSFLVYLALARGDFATLGLKMAPIQGYRYWVKITSVLGGFLGGLILIILVGSRFLGLHLPMPSLTPAEYGPALLNACMVAPLLEEGVYRFALCLAAVRYLKPWGAIALSGAVFAWLHFLYDNPGPDNFIAGYVLAWAYLKSGSLAVPIALHSLGNFCAMTAQLAAWFFQTRG